MCHGDRGKNGISEGDPICSIRSGSCGPHRRRNSNNRRWCFLVQLQKLGLVVVPFIHHHIFSRLECMALPDCTASAKSFQAFLAAAQSSYRLLQSWNFHRVYEGGVNSLLVLCSWRCSCWIGLDDYIPMYNTWTLEFYEESLQPSDDLMIQRVRVLYTNWENLEYEC